MSQSRENRTPNQTLHELTAEIIALRAKLQAAEAETARKESENQRLRDALDEIVRIGRTMNRNTETDYGYIARAALEGGK